jgi:hypothetical protein
MGLLFRQPPAACYSHDGERVDDGCKYLLRSDVMYRKRPGSKKQPCAVLLGTF